MRGIGWHACNENGVILQLFRQRTDKLCLGLIGDLADLRDAESTRPQAERDFGDVAARSQSDFGLELFGQTELRDNLGNVDAGGAATGGIGVNDSLRRDKARVKSSTDFTSSSMPFATTTQIPVLQIGVRLLALIFLAFTSVSMDRDEPMIRSASSPAMVHSFTAPMVP